MISQHKLLWLLKTYAFPVLGIISVALFLQELGVTQRINNFFYDTRASITQDRIDSNIVIIEIDPKSLKEISVWPWPRRYYADLLTKLQKVTVESLFIDIDFSSVSNEKDDLILQKALENARDLNIILPAFWQPLSGSSSGELLLTTPNDQFKDYVSIALTNIQPDSDGLVRKLEMKKLSFPNYEIQPLIVLANNKIDITPLRTLKIDYTISPDSFERVSFVDVLRKDYPIERLHGKTIFVGSTSIELGDILPVPVYRSLPGIVVQGLAYESLLRGPVQSLPSSLHILLMISIVIGMIYLYRKFNWKISLLIFFTSNLILFIVTQFIHDFIRFDVRPGDFTILIILTFLFSVFSILIAQSKDIILKKFMLDKKDELMRNVFNSSNDGIITFNKLGIITEANNAADYIFSNLSDNWKSLSLYELVPGSEILTSRETVRDTMIKSQDRQEFTINILDNNTLSLEISASELRSEPDNCYTATIRDISIRKQQEEKLEYQAFHDALTNLGNRALFNKKLKENIKRNPKEPFSLVIFDINRFKEINDALGHSSGDEALKEIASRLLSLPEYYRDIIRLGGDEFALILKESELKKSIGYILEHLQQVIQKPISLGDISLECLISAGVSKFPEHGTTIDQLLKRADVAMYTAKQNRLLFCIYDEKEDPYSHLK